MSILGDKQNIKVDGTSNKTAGASLFDFSTTTFMVESIKHESAISNILIGLSYFTTDIEYEKPDTLEYTIEQKIDYNELNRYKDFFDDYMENYNLVKNKILIINDEDITFERRLISYIKSKFIKYSIKDVNSNELLDKMVNDIEIELKTYSSLSLEDISSTHYIIFYVFAQCKIYTKPPRN